MGLRETGTPRAEEDTLGRFSKYLCLKLTFLALIYSGVKDIAVCFFKHTGLADAC